MYGEARYAAGFRDGMAAARELMKNTLGEMRCD